MPLNSTIILAPNSYVAQKGVSVLLMVIWIQYFLGTVIMPGVPIIDFFWAILLATMLIFVKPAAIFFVGMVYLFFFVFYSTGAVNDPYGFFSVTYYKTILTWFIFSTLTYGFISQNVKGLRNVKFSTPKIFNIYILQIIFIFLVFLWAFFALRALNQSVLLDFREVTGTGYLTLSDAFAAFSIAYLCRERIPSWEFSAVLGMSVVVIFLLGSRTTLVFFPVAVLFFIGRHVSIRGFFIWAGVIGAISAVMLKGKLDLESGAFFRFFSLISFQGDESGIVRDEFRSQMISRMSENPTCFLVACHPEAGNYDHSVLSVIQYFGFFGLLFLVISTVVAIIRIRYYFKQWYFPLFVYCSLSLIFSRAWVGVIFPIFVPMIIDGVFSLNFRKYTMKFSK